jgi:hypothetical protein
VVAAALPPALRLARPRYADDSWLAAFSDFIRNIYLEVVGEAAETRLDWLWRGQGSSIPILNCTYEKNRWEFYLLKSWEKFGGTIMLEQRILERGSQGEAVKEVQKILLNMGYDLGKAGIDGNFGPETEAAVKNFQGDINLQYPEATVIIDGQVDSQTWFFLNKNRS